jgi:hypothetical protein
MTPTWNTDLLESVGKHFSINFMMKEFPADKQFIIWWINLEQRDKKTKHKRWVLAEEKLDDVGARLERAPRKSLKCQAQETEVLKSSARMTTQLLKLIPYKTTVNLTLQPHNSASRVCFCSWFLQSVVEGEIDPQLTFFSNEAWFHLQGYINMQNNHYWSSQNPHLTHKAPLHPVKVGVWCVCCKCKKDCWICVFNKTIVKNMCRSFSGSSFQS